MHIFDYRVIASPEPVFQCAGGHDLANWAFLRFLVSIESLGAALIQKLLQKRKLRPSVFIAFATCDLCVLSIVRFSGRRALLAQ